MVGWFVAHYKPRAHTLNLKHKLSLQARNSAWLVKARRPSSSDTLPPAGPHFLNFFHTRATNYVPSVQMPSSIEGISFKLPQCICWFLQSHGHIITQNTFSLTSKVPIVFHSHDSFKVCHPKSLLRLEVISLLELPHKSKEQIQNFQHVMEPNMHYHSKGEELSTGEKH